MAELFRSAKLITLLSDYESQGVVGLEAIAVGRPLLVADGTALAELGRFGEVSVVPPSADKHSLGGTHRPQASGERLAAPKPRAAVGQHRRCARVALLRCVELTVHGLRARARRSPR